MGGFIYYGGLPLGSLGRASGLSDGLELAAIVKVIPILAGWVVRAEFAVEFAKMRVKPDPKVDATTQAEIQKNMQSGTRKQ